MKQKLLNIIFALADWFGVNWLARKLTRDKIRVLMYHGVVAEPTFVSRWTVVPAPTFQWQMQYVARHFHAVKATSVWPNRTAKVESNRPCAVITFDDGLLNTLTDVQPILKALHLPAICFVLPGLAIERRQIWADELFEYVLNTDATELHWEQYGLGNISLHPGRSDRAKQIEWVLEQMKTWPHARRVEFMKMNVPIVKAVSQSTTYRLMTIDQILSMAKEGTFEIGIHSDTHPIMSTMSDDQQREEISGAVRKLEQYGIPSVPIFSYPNGWAQNFNSATVAALRQCNFVAALTTIEGLADPDGDLFRIKRIGIGDSMSRGEFKARLSGLFYFLHALYRGRRD